MKKIKFRKEAGKQYDENMRKAAVRRVGIIYLVVAYILYQAYGIVQTKLAGTTSMSWTEVIIAAAVLGVGSLAVAVFATLKMGRELAESEIADEAESDSSDKAAEDTGGMKPDSEEKAAEEAEGMKPDSEDKAAEEPIDMESDSGNNAEE